MPHVLQLLCDAHFLQAFLRLRLMQTWWHRPQYQMCQIHPIWTNWTTRPICSEHLKSYPSQCGTIMVCILLHLSSVSQQPWEATFQDQVKKIEPLFFPQFALGRRQNLNYVLFFGPRKERALLRNAVGKREYQLCVHIVHHLWSLGIVFVELKTLLMSSGRKPFIQRFSWRFFVSLFLEELAYHVDDCVSS